MTDCAAVLWVAWDPSVTFKFGAVKFWVEVKVREDKIRVDCHIQSSLGRLSNDSERNSRKFDFVVKKMLIFCIVLYVK